MRGGSHHRLPLRFACQKCAPGETSSVSPHPSSRLLLHALLEGVAGPFLHPRPSLASPTMADIPPPAIQMNGRGVVFGLATVHLRLDEWQSYPYLE